MSIRFGKYSIHAKLARGGMAEIYLATVYGPQRFAKTVVLKRLFPHLAENPQAVSMFLEEARLAAELQHPHIIQIFELGQQGDNHYISMEYLAGKNLSAIIARSHERSRLLPAEIVAHIGSCIAQGLSYAHHHPSLDGNTYEIVHGDISPSNIVVTFVGEVKIVDFGIAKIVNPAGDFAPPPPGTIQGKLAYLAPEQLNNHQADRRADLFSLGVVLHELLTGGRLFRRGSDPETIQAVLLDPIPDPRTLRPEIPSLLAETVMKALERDPRKRFQYAGEIEKSLDEFLSQQAWMPTFAKLSSFMTELFGEKAAQKAQCIPDYEGTGSITYNTSHLPYWKPIGKVKAIPLITETSALPRKGKQLVRVVGEFPAALYKAGQELVAVPLHVVQFACIWTRRKISLAAFAFGLFGFGMGFTLRETSIPEKESIYPHPEKEKAAVSKPQWTLPLKSKTTPTVLRKDSKRPIAFFDANFHAHTKERWTSPTKGQLEISARGKAYLQDSLWGEAPISKSLPPGTYRVTLIDITGQIQRNWIAVVKPGKITRLAINQ